MTNREEAQKRIDAVARDLKMTKEQREGFHRYLAKNYWNEKDEMNYRRLLQVAQEYLS